MYSFELTFQPTSTTLLRYGTEAQGGGTGTIDKSLSFIYSEDINDTENYVVFAGARCDRTRIEVTPEQVYVTMNWLCKSISTPTSSLPLTTPSWASNDTGTPWVGATSGSNPFIHNSLNYDTDRFTIDVTRNLDAIQVNGQSQISFLVPTNREITGEFDIIRKDTVLTADMKSNTSRSASYVLNSTGPKTATFTNFVIESLKTPHSATSNETPRDTYTYSATALTVTA